MKWIACHECATVSVIKPLKNIGLRFLTRHSIYNGFNTIKILHSSRNYASEKTPSVALTASFKGHTHDGAPDFITIDFFLTTAYLQSAHESRSARGQISWHRRLAKRNIVGIQFPGRNVIADVGQWGGDQRRSGHARRGGLSEAVSKVGTRSRSCHD